MAAMTEQTGEADRSRDQTSAGSAGRHRRDGKEGPGRASDDAVEAAGLDGGSLHGLRAAGPSKVGVSGAMRARDVSRPTEADVELAAMRDVARRSQTNGSAAPGSSPETS